MKKGTVVFLLLALFVVFCAVKVASQEEDLTSITIKSHAANKQMVILDVVQGAKVLEFTCNVGFPNCNDLEPGKYKMVELPKNHGMYECRNVEVYPDAIEERNHEKLLGAYCLVSEKA